jgi:hypothetical protein
LAGGARAELEGERGKETEGERQRQREREKQTKNNFAETGRQKNTDRIKI